MANEISTYKTFLMQGTGTGTLTWAKLIDIKDFPDLGGAPEQIEITTLSDKMRRYIEGIQDSEALSFTANYTKSDYTTLVGLAGSTLDLAVWFGGTEQSDGTVEPSGSAGKFSFKGTVSVFVKGAGVNEAVEMTITVTPSTVISFE